MTDRELLEAAANAAGVDLTDFVWEADGFYRRPIGTGFWNPLNDDIEAFRLMVKMGLRVHVQETQVSVDIYDDGPWIGNITLGIMDSGWNVDVLATTRRAIVRAAAEIWRRKE